MTSATMVLDRLVGRLLLVDAPAIQKPAEPEPETAAAATERNAERAFSLSLVFSGVRCILQYVALPFILPLVGIAGEFSVIISLTINVAAIAAILYSLRTFWRIGYKYRLQYLPVAVTALVLLVSFIVLDVATLG